MVTPEGNAFGVFCGAIDQAAVTRFGHWLTVISQNPTAKQLHLLFQTSGGMVGDSVFLYNLLRASPIDVSLYNAGAVQSGGVIAYLGAKHRLTSKTAIFMIHRTIFTGTGTAKDWTHRSDTLAIDDQRTEAILREHLQLSESRWHDLDSNDVWFTAEEAVSAKMADAIGDFAPPIGMALWDFNTGW